MKIEVLFPEVGNLYGDLENIEYLKRSMPEIEVVETALTEEPLFATEEPSLIYMGMMTEKSQLLVIEKLMPYVDRIKELVAKGTPFLITGNALEIFGDRITYINAGVGVKEKPEDIKCLGITDSIAARDMVNRFNSLYLGNFKIPDTGEEFPVAGFKSQFGHSSSAGCEPLFETTRGPGLSPDVKGEGIRIGNFMATYLIGPLLVLNPPFAGYILKLCGAEDPKLAFEQEAMDAYETRIKEYSDPSTGIYY